MIMHLLKGVMSEYPEMYQWNSYHICCYLRINN